jgi:hypothetical protein
MKKNGTLFTTHLDGEILGGTFLLEDTDHIREHIGSTKRLDVSRDQQKLMSYANRLMTWEAMLYAKEKGIKEFDLGGYYTGKEPDPQKEGINQFKRGFGGKLVNYYNYYKSYSKLYKFATNVYARSIEEYKL